MWSRAKTGLVWELFLVIGVTAVTSRADRGTRLALLSANLQQFTARAWMRSLPASALNWMVLNVVEIHCDGGDVAEEPHPIAAGGNIGALAGIGAVEVERVRADVGGHVNPILPEGRGRRSALEKAACCSAPLRRLLK